MDNLKERIKEYFAPKLKKPAFYGMIAGSLLLLFLIIQSIRLNLLVASEIIFWAGLVLFLLLLAYWFCYLLQGVVSSILGWICLILVFSFSWMQVSAYTQMRGELEVSCAPLKSQDLQFVFYTDKDQNSQSLQSLNDKKVGFLSGRNEAQNDSAITYLEENEIDIEPVYYGTLRELMVALKGQKVSYIGLNNYDLELYELLTYSRDSGVSSSFLGDLVIVGVVQTNQDAYPANPRINVTAQPFTVLTKIYADEDQERIQSIELSVVNPVIQEIYTVNIPRDYWVGYQCSEKACAVSSDRIAYADYEGDTNMVAVVEKLLATKVDFVADINLTSLLPLLDVNFLTIYNPEGLSYKNSYFEQGEIDLLSERARLYAQVIEEVEEGNSNTDFNAWNVFKAFIESGTIKRLDMLDTQIEGLAKSLRTNFTYEQLSDLLKMYIQEKDQYLVTEEALTGNSALLYSPMLTSYAHVITPDQQSLNSISARIAHKLAQRVREQDELSPVQPEPTETTEENRETEETPDENETVREDAEEPEQEYDYSYDYYDYYDSYDPGVYDDLYGMYGYGDDYSGMYDY